MPPTLPTQQITPQISPTLSPYVVSLAAYISTNTKYQGLAIGALIFSKLTITTTTTTSKPTPKILLVQRASHDSFPNCWEMPGGAVDSTDATILDAVIRETWEETGLRLSRIKEVVPVGEGERKEVFAEWIAKREGGLWGKVCFLCEVEDGVRGGEGVDGGDEGEGPKVTLDPVEHQAFGWFGRKELEGLKFAFPDTRECIENGFDAFEML